MRKAKVFISCGQLNDKEKHVGKLVQDYFISREFDTYFAERVHSPESLTENIFNNLKKSEYFVFIDFKRNKISPKTYSGSLFVNQELAIATFLKIETIGFFEKGIKREGIMNYQIHNPIMFNNETEILVILDSQTAHWDNSSYNELEIIFDPLNISYDILMEDNKKSNWYHLTIKNRNKNKHAFDCSCYITKLINLSNSTDFDIPSIEIRWAGLQNPTVNIMSNSKRDLDAFFIVHNNNNIVFPQLNLTSPETKYYLPVLTIGKYLLEYTIISSNFENVSKRYILEINQWDDLNFQEA